MHAYAERLEEVGAPEGIDGAARDGFEEFVDELGEVDEDDAADILAFFDDADGDYGPRE